MSDPRTKLELLYHDALGEIEALVTRIENIKAELPPIFLIQINQLERLADDIQKRLDGALENARGQVFLSMKQEIMSARRVIREESAAIVRAALEQQLSAPTSSLAKSVALLNTAQERLQDTVPGSGFWKLLSASVVGAVIAAGLVVAAATKAPEMFSDSTYQNGKALEMTWPHLSPDMQQELKKAFEQYAR